MLFIIVGICNVKGLVAQLVLQLFLLEYQHIPINHTSYSNSNVESCYSKDANKYCDESIMKTDCSK